MTTQDMIDAQFARTCDSLASLDPKTTGLNQTMQSAHEQRSGLTVDEWRDYQYSSREEALAIIAETDEEARRSYENGSRIIKSFNITQSERSTLTTPDPANANHVMVVDSGYIATMPAYRTIRFYTK